jgi:hypothetical protein
VAVRLQSVEAAIVLDLLAKRKCIISTVAKLQTRQFVKHVVVGTADASI